MGFFEGFIAGKITNSTFLGGALAGGDEVSDYIGAYAGTKSEPSYFEEQQAKRKQEEEEKRRKKFMESD